MGKQGGASGSRRRDESALTRAVTAVVSFLQHSEFEILFLLFFIIAFLVVKEFTSRPEYNDILVKKPGIIGRWPY